MRARCTRAAHAHGRGLTCASPAPSHLVPPAADRQGGCRPARRAPARCTRAAHVHTHPSSCPPQIDKEGANPERVKQELTEHGLLPEEWGGKTPMVPISAKKGSGVDALLETVRGSFEGIRSCP